MAKQEGGAPTANKRSGKVSCGKSMKRAGDWKSARHVAGGTGQPRGSQGEVTRTLTSDCSATPLLNVFYASRHRHLFNFNVLTFSDNMYKEIGKTASLNRDECKCNKQRKVCNILGPCEQLFYQVVSATKLRLPTQVFWFFDEHHIRLDASTGLFFDSPKAMLRRCCLNKKLDVDRRKSHAF